MEIGNIAWVIFTHKLEDKFATPTCIRQLKKMGVLPTDIYVFTDGPTSTLDVDAVISRTYFNRHGNFRGLGAFRGVVKAYDSVFKRTRHNIICRIDPDELLINTNFLKFFPTVDSLFFTYNIENAFSPYSLNFINRKSIGFLNAESKKTDPLLSHLDMGHRIGHTMVYPLQEDHLMYECCKVDLKERVGVCYNLWRHWDFDKKTVDCSENIDIINVGNPMYLCNYKGEERQAIKDQNILEAVEFIS